MMTDCAMQLAPETAETCAREYRQLPFPFYASWASNGHTSTYFVCSMTSGLAVRVLGMTGSDQRADIRI